MSNLLDRLLNYLASFARPAAVPRPVLVRDNPEIPLPATDIEAMSRYRLASLMQYPHY